MKATDVLHFDSGAQFRAWLARHHGTAPAQWVAIAKKNATQWRLGYADALDAALAYGWIDGIKKSLGSDAYLQRLTPRKKGSIWSKRNCDHAERLIAQGRMTPAGRAQVEAAKADGRWSAAYAGPSTMEIPADFRAELAKRPVAAATFATLNKQNLYAIYYRLHSAKTPETRARRMEKLLATLEAGEKFH